MSNPRNELASQILRKKAELESLERRAVKRAEELETKAKKRAVKPIMFKGCKLEYDGVPEATSAEVNQESPVIEAIPVDQNNEELITVEPASTRHQAESLTMSELTSLIEYKGRGYTQTQIARLLNCTQATVSRVLTQLKNTTGLAKMKLEAGAAQLTEDILKDAEPADKIKLLQGLRHEGKRILETDKVAVSTGSGVYVGVQITNLKQ